MTTHNEPARLADRPEDYARFKLAKRQIQKMGGRYPSLPRSTEH